jgi:predicted ester cyclase
LFDLQCAERSVPVMTDPQMVAGTAKTQGRHVPTPVDELDEDTFDSSTAPPMTNVKNPEDPEHRDVPELEANKGIALRFIEGVFINQDPDAVDELAAEDFVAHTFGQLPPGREPLKDAMRRAGAGVSNARFEIHDVIAEQDRVAVRLTTNARHTGTFMGIEASGNEYSIDEIHIFRIEDEKVVEHWHEFDKARLLEQLQGHSKDAATTGREQQPGARPGIEARST